MGLGGPGGREWLRALGEGDPGECAIGTVKRALLRGKELHEQDTVKLEGWC